MQHLNLKPLLNIRNDIKWRCLNLLLTLHTAEADGKFHVSDRASSSDGKLDWCCDSYPGGGSSQKEGEGDEEKRERGKYSLVSKQGFQHFNLQMHRASCTSVRPIFLQSNTKGHVRADLRGVAYLPIMLEFIKGVGDNSSWDTNRLSLIWSP